MFSVKGSYTNPIRFILGINMIRISCFKHEKEILLYSQTLPIKSTKTFDTDDDKLVDHLMFSLKSTKDRITDKDTFLRKIGLRFKAEWLPRIALHPMLNQRSAYTQSGKEKTSLLERLRDELGMLRWLDYIQVASFRNYY